jgi:PAS domain S-box-containing protein
MSTADFKHYARAAGMFCMLLGVAVTLGWLFDFPLLTTVVGGSEAMALNAAISFALAGWALQAFSAARSGKRRVALARASASAGLALAGLTLVQHLFRVDLDSAKWLYGSVVHMAPNTALCLLLVNAALLLLGARQRVARVLAQACGIASFSLAFIAIVGHAYGVRALYGVSGYSAMAVHTAIGLLVLSAGVLAARIQSGVFAVLARDEPAGVVSRRVAPLILVTPFTLGWLCLQGKRLSLYGDEFGLALTVFACTFLMAIIWLWQARVQSDLQAEQRWLANDQRFLIEIGDMLRARVSPDDTLHDVACRLGQYMHVSRCFFSEQDELGDLTTTHRDYAQDLPSFAGTRKLSSFPSDVLDVLRAGHVLVSNDLKTDPRTAPEYERAYHSVGMRARVGVPLLRGGVWVGTLLVTSHEPHAWSGREIALVEVVAEKTWMWFEHLRMLEALQENEARKSLILNSAFDAIVSMDPSGVVLEWNPAAERMFGRPRAEAIGQPMTELLTAAGDISAPAGPALDRTFELTARRKDGSTFEAELVLTRAQSRGLPLYTAFVRDISERQRLARERDLASEALQTSEQRFRALIDASAQIVWTATANSEIVEDSPSWRAFTGQSLEEWRSARLQVLHPGDLETVRTAWAAARSQKRPVELEFRVRRHDGEWRWMVMRGVPVSNPDGSVREWVGMNIDIHDRRAAEETRRLAERMRERGRFFELSLDLVCIVGTQGQLLELNPSFTQTLGYTAHELLEQPFLSLVHPDDREASARDMLKLAAGERNAAFTNRYRGKDGSYRTLQWRAAPDEAGLVYATARDITEDQRKAAALAESEERARILIEGARDYAIIMLDPNGHVTTWNAGAERIKGFRPCEIIGQHFSIFYTETDLARDHPANELALASEHGRYEEEGWRLRKDGSRFWANVVISALRDQDGQLRGFAKVTRDFTERQRARAELEAREASLAASLKERELLLQEIHHRVKNNLQVIASLISMQIRKLTDAASREALDECRARVQAIALIHEQLYRSHDFSSVPFSAYARNLAANIFQTAGLAPDSIKLKLKVESVLMPVDKAIPCGLILNELLTNALKHAFPSDRRGSVSVELLSTMEGGISLIVADDGVGIAEDFSIERSRSLGMQLVATLVEQLGGQLSISRIGGTAFGITIPANAA